MHCVFISISNSLSFSHIALFCCAACRTFANETSQFLAPYNNNIAMSGDGPQNVALASAASNPGIYASSNAGNSLSSNELARQTMDKRVEAWNPFEEEQPFSQMTEDHIFEAEFDKIRQRGSQGSE